MALDRLSFGSRAALLLATVLAGAPFQPLAVRAAEPITPTLDVKDMRLVVSYVSRAELVGLQRKNGAHIDLRQIRQDYRHGFSILKTNRETGARTCEIYLAREQRPRRRDDSATLTLGHELLHCMLGDYHR